MCAEVHLCSVRMEYFYTVFHRICFIAYFVLSANIIDATTRMNIHFHRFYEPDYSSYNGTHIAHVNSVVMFYWNLLSTVQDNE